MGDIRIYKTQRGGKKMICTVVGLQSYGINLKDMAKIMGKKFACGASVADDDKHGECIQIQGDVEERFIDMMEVELAKYKVTEDKIKFEAVKKKKKATAEGHDDNEEAWIRDMIIIIIFLTLLKITRFFPTYRPTLGAVSLMIFGCS